MKIKLKQDCDLALNGLDITPHKKNEVLEVSDRLAGILLDSKRAVEAKQTTKASPVKETTSRKSK